MKLTTEVGDDGAAGLAGRILVWGSAKKKKKIETPFLIGYKWIFVYVLFYMIYSNTPRLYSQ